MATYYVAEGGTAANKAAATTGTYPGGCMSVTVHNGETFSAGDEIHFSDEGGPIRATVIPPSSGSSGSPIIYKNKSGDTPIITGADAVTGWTSGGELTTDSDTMLLLDFDNDLTDSSSNGRDFTDGDSISYTTGPFDNAAVFNGTSDYVYYADDEAGDSDAFDFAYNDSFTIEAWIKPSGTGYQEIVSKNVFGVGGFRLFVDNEAGGSDFRAMVYDGTTERWINSGIDVVDGNWHHVAVRYDGAGEIDSKIRAYVDGTERGSNYDVFGSGTIASSTDILIGARTGGSNYFEGDIAQVRISSVARATFPSSTGTANVWTATLAADPGNLTINGDFYYNYVATAGAVDAAREWNHAGTILTVYATSEPTNVEAGARDFCITDNNTARNYLTFDGLTIRGWQDEGIWFINTSGTNITIQNCTFEFGGHHTNGTYDSIGLLYDYATVQNCTFSESIGVGVNLTNSTNGLIQDCEMTTLRSGDANAVPNDAVIIYDMVDTVVRRVTSDKTDATVPAHKPHLLLSGSAGTFNNVTVEQCKFLGGDAGIGIDTLGDLDNLTIQNCYFSGQGENAWQSAISAGAGTRKDGAVIRNNVIVDFGQEGIRFQAVSTGVKIYGNSLYTASTATTGVHLESFTGEFKNNSIKVDSGKAAIMNSVSNVTSDYNNFGPERTDYLASGGTSYSTLAAWRSATSKDANSISSDPLYTDEDTGDLTLTSSSPNIGAGVDLGASYDDALLPSSTWPDGVVTGDQDDYGAGWEVGAYVFPVYSLTIADASHALTSENLGLTQKQLLAIANAAHALSSDGLELSYSASVSIDANRIARIIFVLK